ncbi:MAG: recombinase family protein [Aeriscardovia sp.]|nr:recombinase family protein [Aeriscardovia sp.]
MLPKQTEYKVGMYLRLSKDDERAGESLSIENQRRVLTNHIREQGWTLYDEYVDDGISGTTFDEHPNGNKTTCRANSILTIRALHLRNALFLIR